MLEYPECRPTLRLNVGSFKENALAVQKDTTETE